MDSVWILEVGKHMNPGVYEIHSVHRTAESAHAAAENCRSQGSATWVSEQYVST